MPPKRAKGLKHSVTTANTTTTDVTDEPNAKRPRINDEPESDNCTNEPIYVGEADEGNEVAEVTALLNAAKSRLICATKNSTEYSEGQSLLRATLHECSRLLSLDTTTNMDRIHLYPLYAMALFWTVTYSTESNVTPQEMLDLALDQLNTNLDTNNDDTSTIDATSTNNSDNDVTTTVTTTPLYVKEQVKVILDIGIRLVQGQPIPIDDPVWDNYNKDTRIDMDDREALGWLVLRKLELMDDTDFIPWVNTCIKVWHSVTNEQTKKRALGIIKLEQGSRLIAEQGEIAETDDESNIDIDIIKSAQETLNEAYTLLTEAKDLDDHPNDTIYQPLGDVCTQLATAAEFLDQTNDAIQYHKFAVQHLKKAREYNAEAVDEELINNLESCIEALIQDEQQVNDTE